MLRLFIDKPLAVEQDLLLNKESAHYILNVLRQSKGATVTLFNGQGGEYIARLTAVAKKTARLQIYEYKAIERESALQLTLVQAISRPQHMDHTIQKSVELGVQRIVPIITERSAPGAKSSKREQHWRKIIISACEQSGRNRLPHLENVQSLQAWLAKPTVSSCLVLSPKGKNGLSQAVTRGNRVTVLNGPEGGLTEEEIGQAMQADYLDICLGQRILRTETAAVAVLAGCQALVGDFGILDENYTGTNY